MANSADKALTLEQALLEEGRHVHDDDFGRIPENDQSSGNTDEQNIDRFVSAVHKLRDDREPVALCLSGGGIRSATFALGFLQGLARRKLLKRIQYLSTVSGGGFIGSWLSAWIHRDGLDKVSQQLGDHQDVAPIQHLRRYSSYLAPRRGVSLDLLATVGIVARNGLLNWLVWIPLCLALLALPRLVLALTRALSEHVSSASTVFAVVAGSASIALVAYIWVTVPDSNSKEIQPPRPICFWLVLPLAAISLALSRAGMPEAVDALAGLGDFVRKFGVHLPSWIRPDIPPHSLASWVAAGAILGSALCLVGTLLGAIANAVRSVLITLALQPVLMPSSAPPSGWRIGILIPSSVGKALMAQSAISSAAIGAVTGALAGLGFWLLRHPKDAAEAYTVLAAPMLLTAYWIGTCFCVGLSGRSTPEGTREWWARASALAIRPVLIWLPLAAIVIYGPKVLLRTGVSATASIAALGGLGGLASLLIGYFSNSGMDLPSQSGSRWRASLERFLLPGSAALFLVMLAIAASLGMSVAFSPDEFKTQEVETAALTTIKSKVSIFGKYNQAMVAEKIDPGPVVDRAIQDEARQMLGDSVRWGSGAARFLGALLDAHENALKEAPLVGVTVFVAVLLVWAFFFSRRIGVNRFSLHSMYGNRLVRAYLGASNQNRTSSSVQLFDDQDNLLFSKFEVKPESRVPFQVLNLALNLANGERLDWQQRKAASFTMTPLHSGSAATGYRRSPDYGGTDGMSLGKAMTISGAAVSPAMGYHSSKIVTFALTLFNMRLGWWLPNPRLCDPEALRSSEPPLGISAPLQELLGLTSEKSKYVYLSDGGHFDNLGIYEMILRRCKKIVVVDATQDVEFAYDDLARVLRMIRTDLGIEVEIEGDPTQQVGAKATSRFSVWRVRYSAREEGPDGVLVHVKPKLLGSEPLDLTRHAAIRLRAGKRFPHDSTSDQFFDEAQFESYRKLGLISAEDVMTALPNLFTSSANGVLSEFLTSRQAQMPVTASLAPSTPNGAGDNSGQLPGVWSKLLKQGSGWLAPAILTSAVAVTVSATVTGTLGLASNELKLANPQITLSTPPALLLDPNAVLRVEPIMPSVSISPDDATKELISRPPKIGLDPALGTLAINGIPIASEDLRRLERVSAAFEDVKLPQQLLTEIRDSSKRVEKEIQALTKQVGEIDPQRVVQGN